MSYRGSGWREHTEQLALSRAHLADEVEKELARWIPENPMSVEEEREIRGKCKVRIESYRKEARSLMAEIWEYDREMGVGG